MHKLWDRSTIQELGENTLTFDNLLSRNKNCLDLIRFVAAGSVLISHAFPLSRGANVVDPFARWTQHQATLGELAVATFFIVSGFLIPASWERHADPVGFAISRILRIVPALVVVVLLSVVVLGPIVTTVPLTEYLHSPTTLRYLETATLLRTHYTLPGVFESNVYPAAVNGSLWTLPVEVACYLAVLALGTLCALRRTLILPLLLLFGLIVFLGIDQYYVIRYGFGIQMLDGIHNAMATPIVKQALEPMLYFSGGTLVYYFRDRLRPTKTGLLASAFVLTGSCALGLGLTYVMATFGAYLVLGMASTRNHWVRLPFQSDYSYGIYIFAFPVQQIIVQAWGGSMPVLWNVVCALPITLAFAIVSWHLIEKPALGLRRRSKIQDNRQPKLQPGS